MPEDSGVRRIECKINPRAPAEGREFIATARVVRVGRTISSVAGAPKLVAIVQTTMMRAEASPAIRV
jgi:acyl-coenzyme A thioesterase PaaI-like protein